MAQTNNPKKPTTQAKPTQSTQQKTTQNTQKKPAPKKTQQGGEKVRYQRRSFFWNVFAVIIAFILGILAAIGGLIGGGYFAASKISIATLMETFGVKNYNDYINEEFANKTVLELASQIKDGGFENLNSIGQYTPILENQLNNLANSASQFGLNVNVEELMTVAFSNLGTYMKDNVINKVELGKIMGITANSTPMLREIFYGKEGISYELVTGEDGKLKIQMIEGHEPLTVGTFDQSANQIINNMEVGIMLNLTPASDPMMIELCYGIEGVDYEIKEDKISPFYPEEEEGTPAPASEEEFVLTYPAIVNTFTAHATDYVNNLRVETVLKTNALSKDPLPYLAYGSEGVHYDIKEGEIVMRNDPETGKPYEKRKLSSLTGGEDILENATVGELAKIDGTSSNLFQAIAGYTIAELKREETILNLTIGDFLSIEDTNSGIMKEIKDWKLSELKQQHRVERIKLSAIMEIDETSSILAKTLKDWRLGDLGKQEKINEITLGSVLEITDTSPEILKAIKNIRIGNLTEEVQNITISELFKSEDVANNHILKHLTSVKLIDLDTEVEKLTIEQVFGDQIFSYATAENVQALRNEEGPQRIPSNAKWKHEEVTEQYVVGATPVKLGYFLDLDGELTFVGNTYVAKSSYSYPVYSETTFSIIDPDTGVLTPTADVTETDGEFYYQGVKLSSDAYSDYVEIDGARIDFDKRVTYYNETTHEPVPLSATVNGTTATDDSRNIVALYYTETDGVYTTYSEATTVYTVTETGETVVPYLDGVWWLILGADLSVLQTPAIDTSTLVTGTTEKIKACTLGDLYLHGLTNENPDHALPADNPTGKTNMKDLKIDEMLAYLKLLLPTE